MNETIFPTHAMRANDAAERVDEVRQRIANAEPEIERLRAEIAALKRLR